MKPEDLKKDKKARQNNVIAGIGIRIVKSMFFWCLAAILAFSAYTDIVKISGGRMQGTSTGADVSSEEGTLYQDSAVSPENAVQNTDEDFAAAPENAVQNTDRDSVTSPENAVQNFDGDAADRKRVALTFDDGPHPYYTKELLDGLKERNVKATFFVVGKNIPGNEDVIRQMDQEGHLIGNHTYDHVKICDMNGPDACEQIEKTSSLIRELTGSDTEFVRPPFGAWNKDMECSFVMIPVLWDVDPRDWCTNNTSDIVRKVLNDTKNGDIILLHDYYKSSVKAALEIVDKLQEQGYEFVTVEELILE